MTTVKLHETVQKTFALESPTLKVVVHAGNGSVDGPGLGWSAVVSITKRTAPTLRTYQAIGDYLRAQPGINRDLSRDYGGTQSHQFYLHGVRFTPRIVDYLRELLAEPVKKPRARR